MIWLMATFVLGLLTGMLAMQQGEQPLDNEATQAFRSALDRIASGDAPSNGTEKEYGQCCSRLADKVLREHPRKVKP